MNWIAMIGVLLGYFLVVRMPLRPLGYWIQIIGCVAYLWLFLTTDLTIVIVNTVFIATNIYGLYRTRVGLK